MSLRGSIRTVHTKDWSYWRLGDYSQQILSHDLRARRSKGAVASSLCCEWRHVQLVSFLKVCTLGWPDVFMGISTQANGRETAHSEEAWWAASSLVQPVPVVLILSLVAKASSLCVPPQGWSGKFIVKTQGKGQGRTPPESWGDCLRQGLDLLGSSDSTDQPPSPKKQF